MLKHTLRKLKQNPFYALNNKQAQEDMEEELQEENVIEYGEVETHDATFETHEVKPKRRRRRKKE